MNAAIIFTGKFGSTRQYANWISETTGFPVFDLQQQNPDPQEYDLLILGSSVIDGQLTIRKWVRANWLKIRGKSIIFFSVSGTEPEPVDLGRCLEVSLPTEMIWKMDHVALTGKFPLSQENWWSRLLLRLGLKRENNAAGQESESIRLDSSHRHSLGVLFERLGRYYEETLKVRPKPAVEMVAGELELA